MISKDKFKTSILPVTLKNEGGYSNIKGDNGGETYRGIARNSNPNWIGWELLERHKPLKNGDMVNDRSLMDAICDIYWKNYFEAYNLHKCENVVVALQIFDFAVHGGFSIKKLQTEINRLYNKNLTVDGVMGDKTITAINEIKPDLLCHTIIYLRSEHLRILLANDPWASKFEAGWKNRIVAMRNLIKQA